MELNSKMQELLGTNRAEQQYVGHEFASYNLHVINFISYLIQKSAFKDLNNREGPLVIDFLEYYYFPREPQLMAGTLSPSNLVHLSLDTQSSL